MGLVPQKVHLIAATWFAAGEAKRLTGWTTDADGGEALAEFAGRLCYMSWKKPNPKTATNAGYLGHILETGHFSVLEHGSVSFYFEGISRSLTHELIRHRHFSYSQLSQRYVPEGDANFVVPDAIAEDKELLELFKSATEQALEAYRLFASSLEEKFSATKGGTILRKLARQAARSILPNATETRIVVTGNYRAWRHFIALRATEHADVEIRELAITCLRDLQMVAPNVFNDFKVTQLDDGTFVAHSPYAERS
jgi:thymidylate synthase (FAD)